MEQERTPTRPGTEETKLSGLWRRAKAWGSARFLGSRHSVSREPLREAVSGARRVLDVETPKVGEIVASYEGRYTDGGLSRFRVAVERQELGDADLQWLERRWASERLVYGLAAIVFALAGPALWILGNGGPWVITAILVMLFAVCFFAAAVRSDFSRWQVANRRFGGVVEYLSTRFGSGRRSQVLWR